ncbi:MAG: hypothetical protein HYR85_14910 [Planctomycetes bacterium]|nr:hypothetical protein [Planctomycetota bacterium]
MARPKRAFDPSLPFIAKLSRDALDLRPDLTVEHFLADRIHLNRAGQKLTGERTYAKVASLLTQSESSRQR